MIKHIVSFKLKDKSEENLKYTRDILLSMRENVPLVKDIQVGLDFLHSQRSYDVILEVILESRDVLDDYQNDPYHVNVVKKHMHAASESSISVDYDL